MKPKEMKIAKDIIEGEFRQFPISFFVFSWYNNSVSKNYFTY